MKKKINNLTDYFLPATSLNDTSAIEKSRITVLIFLIVSCITIIYSLFYIQRGYLFDIKAFHNYLGVFSTLFCLIIIKKTGKIDTALSIMAIIGIYLVTASIYLSGGIHSNDILWYMVMSTSSFMFISIRTGVIVTLLSFLGMTLFFILEANGIKKFRNDLTSSSLEYRYFNFVLILTVLAFMVYVLVKGNVKLLKLIQMSREQKLREEIAQDFHDQIGNKLASLMHLSELAKLKKDDAQKELLLAKITDKSKDVYDNFRDFIWTIDSKSDYAQELFMYLRDFMDDYFKFSEMKIYITTVPEILPDFILPGYLSKEIVPIFKEAITNISKHSKAENIWFHFSINSKTLEISLKDDGVGLEKDYKKNGNGIKNIELRSNRSGGTIQIKSNQNQGTEIIFTAELPVLGS